VLSLQDQVVIVTGSAQGIGERIARTLAERGARLLLADIQAERIEAVAADLRANGVEAYAQYVDVSDPDLSAAMAQAAMTRFGRIDALVNDGAIDALPGLAWEIDRDHWRRFVDTDLSGQWWNTQAVLPHMIERRSGRIIFISSIVARMGSPIYSPAYSAAKAGLLGLTIALAVQLEQYGILVNAITPGAIGTTGTPMQDDEKRDYLAAYPLGLGGPQPVADAVAYLLEPSGDWISGAVLNVTGGGLRGP
jgi:NAD(P)-dependent dehydrogenase (short-subunit alcohol dehydrogenase family)